ncbi:hypothetical protein LSH36_63g06038 [Paralvinella palmiformis]|uniref:Carboxylic ester hydrolase n=1 Tax=Paralvinella palmiformis TaxID=53620 RepID=A0AAD9K427_9ANNE|nr:hypothetical protein LSH36_63g06038 [Paralvinella palmiformis]
MFIIWLFVVLLLEFGQIHFVSSQDEDPIVETNYGLLRGFADQDRFNRSYDAFLGVPFAKPPIGDLRWQVPDQPPESWSHIRNATEFSPHCIQIISDLYRFIGFGRNDSEDCLYLNIYVPGSVEEALANPLPVMVFFYGGAYAVGTAEMYPGQELATDGNVVVVTVNYRVNVMGFFSTGDDAAPGNYGLWDAKAALQWIKDNIIYFGGDPDTITVFGQSAGSGITEHCLLSPHTNTLFQRVIALSGSVNTVVGYNPDPKRNAQYLADIYFCNTTDSYEIVACLMEKDAKHLDTWSLISIYRNESRIPNFMPVIDGNFVFQDTRKSFEEGVGKDIDLLTGRCFDDGAGFVLANPMGRPPLLNVSKDPNRDNEAVTEYFMTMLGFYENAQELYQMLYEHNPDINSSDPETCSKAATRVTTDVMFQSGAHYDVLKHAQAKGSGSTYLYQFRHRQSFLTGYPDWVNGSHIDDIYSVLGDPFMKIFRILFMDEDEFSPEDEIVATNIRNYYTNFAYTGNPNQGPYQVPTEWPEYDPEDGQRYLIESVQPWIEEETTEFIEEMNWYLYDFWPLIRPAWDVNSTEIQSLDVASEEQQEPITEEDLEAGINTLKEKVSEFVNWDDVIMEEIDERIISGPNMEPTRKGKKRTPKKYVEKGSLERHKDDMLQLEGS